MTEEEYVKAKKAIVEQYGKPEYEMAEPTNESAKKLTELRRLRQAETRKKNKLDQAGEIAQADAVLKFSKAIPIELTENDLLPFNEIEREILKVHFANTNLDCGQVAKVVGSSTTKVASLFRSGPYKVLADRVFNHLAPMEAKASILKGLRQNVTQITLRVAEHFDILKSEEIKITKPIDDPETLALLKKLGDEQAQRKGTPE